MCGYDTKEQVDKAVAYETASNAAFLNEPLLNSANTTTMFILLYFTFKLNKFQKVKSQIPKTNPVFPDI